MVRDLGATYIVHLRHIGKRVVDFLLVLTVLIDATAEALRANIDRKSAFSLQRRPVDPKIQVERSPLPTILLLRKLKLG